MAVSPIPEKTLSLPVTVLLVDDQPIVGEAVRRMLASETTLFSIFAPILLVPLTRPIPCSRQ